MTHSRIFKYQNYNKIELGNRECSFSVQLELRRCRFVQCNGGFNRAANEQLPPSPLHRKPLQGPMTKNKIMIVINIQTLHFDSYYYTYPVFSKLPLHLPPNMGPSEHLPLGPFFLNPPLVQWHD